MPDSGHPLFVFMQTHGRRRSESGFTLIELLIVFAIVGILGSLAVAGYRMVRLRAAEASALTSLQAINQAQFVFSQTCGNKRFSPTLAGGVAQPGPADCNGTATEMDYISTAVPAQPGTTGNRRFGTTAAGTVFQNASATPVYADMAAGGTATTTPIQ